MNISIWFGLFAIAGTDMKIVNKLSDNCGRVVESKDFSDLAKKTRQYPNVSPSSGIQEVLPG